jgi:hypothetical protein
MNIRSTEISNVPHHGIPVTRWVDDGTKPTSHSDWAHQQRFPTPFIADSVVVVPPTVAPRFCILINENIYDGILASINQYVADLIAEDFSVEVIVSSGGGTPEDLKELLKEKYLNGMEGCLLIGDFPVPWYEATCWGSSEQFPIDLFYMDMNGVWSDSNSNDIYDSHTGNTGPEIWMGRLTASPLTVSGDNEVELLNNYFAKNHQFRTGNLVVQDRGLTYVDDDWEPMAGVWLTDHSLAYYDQVGVSTWYTTIDTDYESRLPQGFQSILLACHSTSTAHHFKNGSTWDGLTFFSEVVLIDPVAIFYNLFACSNSRYIEYNYMGGWYIFCQSYGLVSVGSTKTGSMLDFSYFYRPFGSCATIGESFRDWFLAVGVVDVCWFYGMTLCGDPTLRISTGQVFYVEPSGVCNGKLPCWATIQEAIDNVNCGATIRVAVGNYDEHIAVNKNPLTNYNNRVTISGGWESAFSEVVAVSTINSLTIAGSIASLLGIVIQ